MSLTRALCLSAVSSLFALGLAAQTPDWNNVKSIAPATQILIARAGSSAVRGELQSVSDDSISINASSGQQSVPRGQVARLSVRKKGNRGRHALIGLVIGAGAGAVVGAASYSSCNGFCIINPSRGALAGAGAAVGGLLGAGVGALLPSGGWREVYRQ